jgi:DegV family protein with EDD domain
MNQYKIITDFCSDLTLEMAEKLDVEIIPMEVVFDGEAPVSGFDIEVSEFYAKLRAKQSAQTSAANLDSFINTFEKYLAEGQDIIYIGIAAGLSCTFASAKLAASELSEKYPERKIYLVNSRSGSIGEGLIVHFAAQKKAEGLTARENYNYLKNLVKNFHSEFTLNDLFFLKRGGRLSTATAVIGSVLALKPLITLNEAEKLEVAGKARGRKNALLSLVKSLETLVDDPTESVIAIGHSDCLEDAINLEMMIRAKWDVKDIILADIGPAMGAHCGPDTVAIFFEKSEKKEEPEIEVEIEIEASEEPEEAPVETTAEEIIIEN